MRFKLPDPRVVRSHSVNLVQIDLTTDGNKHMDKGWKDEYELLTVRFSFAYYKYARACKNFFDSKCNAGFCTANEKVRRELNFIGHKIAIFQSESALIQKNFFFQLLRPFFRIQWKKVFKYKYDKEVEKERFFF